MHRHPPKEFLELEAIKAYWRICACYWVWVCSEISWAYGCWGKQW